MAARELRDLDVPFEVEARDLMRWQVPPQVRRQGGPVELLGCSDVSRVALHGLLLPAAERKRLLQVGSGLRVTRIQADRLAKLFNRLRDPSL